MNRHSFVILVLLVVTGSTAAIGQEDPDPPGAGLRFVNRASPGAPPGEPPRWTASLAAAREIAAREGRSILIYFGAVW